MIAIILALSGCAGYKVGAKSLYKEGIQTIYVPMFESDSFRRNMAERLTEAVCKRIEERTPYKVIARPSADSVLTGKLIGEKQVVSIENEYDDVRQKNVINSVEVIWADRRGSELRRAEAIPWGVNTASITTNWNMVAEMGDSTVMAQQKAIDKMADQIVDMMQEPW